MNPEFTPSDGSEPPIDPAGKSFYRRGLKLLNDAGVPFLVGGAYALERYTGISRHTKDLDIFVRPGDRDRIIGILASAGYQTDIAFPHWLAKAYYGEYFIDIIFNSGNGICVVDDAWFRHAPRREVLGIPVSLCPAEEMIWSKSFILERERYDGADIAHVIRECGERLNWPRLIERFGAHWRVLLSHLVLFGFIYPAERGRIPEWVMQRLLALLTDEVRSAPPSVQICQGTLLSREQYLTDVMRWGYEDARLQPNGRMTRENIAHWTAAIDEKK
ncbi:nucleotidyltransferase family protein [Methylocaldum sp. MU1018]